MKLYKPARKPRPSTAMKFGGLDHAKKYEDFSAEQWGKVLLSDKSLVQQFVVCSRHVRTPPGKM